MAAPEFISGIIKGLIPLIIIASSLNSSAQQLLNLDFEKTGPEGINRPWGWSVESYTNTTIVLDSITKHHGKFSLKMNAASPEQESQVLGFGIEVFELQHKTVTVNGWIKTTDLKGSAFFTTGYSLAADTAATEMKSREISNTQDWQPVSLTLQIPAAVEQFYITIQHKGAGTSWFDDFSLSINGKKVAEVEVAAPFNHSQISWLSSSSYPLSTVDATSVDVNTSSDDLAPFKQLVNGAKIIGLGEATHGTSEFFRFKHRLLQYSVERLGVRIFGIEDNLLVIERVNKYVSGGDGDARASMYGMFSVWQTEEVRDMIQWIRNYNDKHPTDKVEITGFDIQSLSQPMDSLYAFVKRREPQLFGTTTELLSDLKERGINSYTVSDTVKLHWLHNAETILKMLSSRKNDWLSIAKNQADSAAVYWGIQYANLVKQYAENIYKGHLSLYRDVAMAENISWILQMHGPDSKILIWAHDNHISRGDHQDNEVNIYNGHSMGAHLSKKYGTMYKAFGLSTYQGAYWAQVSYTNFTMMSCPLYPAPRGSLDEALHQISLQKKTPLLLLDLSKARNQSWLTLAVPVRFANHVNIEYGYWTKFSIPYQFDGIFFIDITTPAKSYAR